MQTQNGAAFPPLPAKRGRGFHAEDQVTCAQGRNRSGLVASLALMLPGRWPTPSCLSGREVIGLMKGRRGPGALTNEYFQKILKAT